MRLFMTGAVLIVLQIAGAFGGAFPQGPPGQAGAQSPNPESVILGRSDYTFPPYAEVRGLERSATLEEYAQAIADTRFVFEKVWYHSDGLRVIAYLYRPRETAGRKLPVVIFNRGSYTVGDQAPRLIVQFHRFVEGGFVVLAPMYRGSDGGEGRDEMGGADCNDLTNALRVVEWLDFADRENLFLYGESRGGMMVLQAVRDRFPAAAAAVYGTFTDLDRLMQSDPKLYQPLTQTIWPNFAAQSGEILATRSAVRWADRLDAPILIQHGGADRSVSATHALALAEALEQQSKTYELVIYAGDNHVLSANREERDRRAMAWFRRHMKK